MGRPKKETYKIDEVYLVDALLLAGQYAGMLKEKQYYENIYQGVEYYTEEMAISDLMGSCYSDMERVQSSNISKPAERIGILLADGYVEKKNAELYAEAVKLREEYEEICEKIDIVEVAMKERMTKKERCIFQQIFVGCRSWSEVKDPLGNQIDKHQVSRERDKAIVALAQELEVRKYLLGRK